MQRALYTFSLVGLVGLIAIGCSARYAQPTFYKGYYYMAGDESCVSMREMWPGRIMCLDKNHMETGWRDAMTDQQLMMYQAQVQQRNQEILQTLQLLSQLQQAGESMREAGMRMLEQSRQFQTPYVAPLAPPQNSRTHCVMVGNQLICQSEDSRTNCIRTGYNIICR